MSASSSGSDDTGGRSPAALLPARVVGLGVVAFAAALWFWLIPWQVETAGSGFVRPRTLPQICAVGIGLCGLLLLAFPGGAPEVNLRQNLRGTFVLAVCGMTVWVMGHWGFLATTPVLALVLAAALGERRLPWLLATVVVLPLTIWLVVEPLLGRTLP